MLCLALSTSALAVEDADLEIVVTSDPYARWDDTRWRIDVQTGMPFPVTLYSWQNKELQAVSLDTRAVFACDLGPQLTRKTREVSCEIEDIAVSAAPWFRKPMAGQEVLDETVDRLTGMTFVLQVSEDGRVTNVGLTDEPQRNRRVNVVYENLRQIVRSFVVGFHLRAPDRYVVGREWIEKNSALFQIPVFRRVAMSGVGGVGGYPVGESSLTGYGGASPVTGASTSSVSGAYTLNVNAVQDFDFTLIASSESSLAGRHPFDVVLAPASMGRSTLIHRMDPYRGKYVVQSVGRGTVDIGAQQPMIYMGEASAVSVYSSDEAIMQERVWSLQLMPTASNELANGVAGWPYWQLGKLQMLGPDEASEVGRSALVAPPQTERGNLPPWPAL
jgi:hypothetical protein